MIHPTSSVSRLQNLSPVRPSRPCESAAGDGFVSSSNSSPGIYAPRASEEVAPTESSESLGQKAMLATCLAVSAAAGVLAFVPSAAAAQVQMQPQRQVRDPALRQLLASSLVTGKVKSVDARGAEIDLGQDVVGYLRASEISRDRVEDASQVLKVGDEVTAVVVNVDRKTRNIQLSVKAKDAADQQEAMSSLSQSSGTAGTTSLGALLRAKLDSSEK